VTKTGPGARPMGRVDDGGGGDAVWTLNNSDQPPIHYVQCSYMRNGSQWLLCNCFFGRKTLENFEKKLCHNITLLTHTVTPIVRKVLTSLCMFLFHQLVYADQTAPQL